MISKKLKLVLLLCTSVYILFFILSINGHREQDELIMTDVSRLMPVKVMKIVKEKEEEAILQVIQEAKQKGLKISIAGQRHSMGGHTYYKDAVVLDMTEYNRILDFNQEKKTIRVQSGATWDDIQQVINPYGLAVKVMQSQNIFTIGGSMSANAHGRDIRYGSLIDTITSFRLINAEGEIIQVSREENKELFPLVIGGYGLFGVILDVDIELTNDELYEMQTKVMDYKEYAQYFKEEVKDNPDVRMHLARISTAPDSFLTEMYVTDYVLASEEIQKKLGEYNQLKEDQHTWITKLMLGLSRKFDWGKNIFWDMQKSYFMSTNGSLVTRNNVMRSESKFLEYEHQSKTDVLQEYFIPINQFPAYIDALRELLSEEDLNVVNITIRYVQKNEEAVLSYAKDDMFALVLLINHGLSGKEQEEATRVIQKMIDITLDHHGSYYLPYMPYPTKEQMLKAYPRTDEFFQKKLRYDPDELFTNFFYEGYK